MLRSKSSIKKSIRLFEVLLGEGKIDKGYRYYYCGKLFYVFEDF